MHGLNSEGDDPSEKQKGRPPGQEDGTEPLESVDEIKNAAASNVNARVDSFAHLSGDEFARLPVGTTRRMPDGTWHQVGIDGEVMEFSQEPNFVNEDADPTKAKILRPKKGETWCVRFLPTLVQDIVKTRAACHEWPGPFGQIGVTCFKRLKIPCFTVYAPTDASRPKGKCPICSVWAETGLDELLKHVGQPKCEWHLPVIVIEVKRAGAEWTSPPRDIIALKTHRRVIEKLLAVADRLVKESKAKDRDDAIAQIGDLQSGFAFDIERASDEYGTCTVSERSIKLSAVEIEWLTRRRRLYTLQRVLRSHMTYAEADELAATLKVWQGAKLPNGRAQEVKAMFGGNVTLIPQHLGTKRPVARGYFDLAKAWMQHEADYFPVLDAANIAVVVGPNSGHIVSIDLDGDEYSQPFLKLNPWARDAQFSAGGRGGNFWFKITGEYPHQILKITRPGDKAGEHKPVGEFRGGRCLTTASGIHKSGKPYTVKNEGNIPEITFADIKWPVGWTVEAVKADRPRGANYAGDGYCMLDVSLLENPRKGANGADYRCPACSENGEDKAGNHLHVFPSGHYWCIKHDSPEHRARIRELVGRKQIFADDYEGVASGESDSTEANLIHPAKWFAWKFPELTRAHGDAVRVTVEENKRKDEGEARFRFSDLNEVFFGHVLGEATSPTAPVVYANDEKRFYGYSPADGVFRAMEAEDVQMRIATLLRECASYYAGVPWVDTSGLTYTLTKKKVLDGIVAKARSCLKVNASEYFAGASKDAIACDNGLLDLATLNLRPFTPQMRRRAKIPTKAVPGAECPRFVEFMNHLVKRDDDKAVIQQYLGQCLTGRNWSQRLLIIQGEGGIGKGTISKVLQGIIGAQNFVGLRSGQLGSRFEMSRLAGKWVAFDGDAPANLLSNNSAYLLKGLTGGDLLPVERKNCNDELSQTIAINIICCTNLKMLVQLSGDESAWERRLVYLTLNSESPAEVIREIEGVLLGEASGILNWLLTGARQLANAGWSIQLSEHQKGVVDALLYESANVSAFARECVVADRGDSLTSDEAYQSYMSFCADREWQTLPRKKFGERISKAMLEEHRVSQANNILRRGHNQRGWRNVTIRPEWDKRSAVDLD